MQTKNEMIEVNHTILPEEVENEFSAVAQGVGRLHRALGRIVDCYVSEVPHGYHMAVYESFADLYHRITGEHISARTIRFWRKSAVEFSKADLKEFHALSDSMLTESVILAEVANIEAKEICKWAVEKAVDSVPALRAHWLPIESGDDLYHQDPPVISNLLRLAREMTGERRERLDKLIDEIRKLLAEVS